MEFTLDFFELFCSLIMFAGEVEYRQEDRTFSERLNFCAFESMTNPETRFKPEKKSTERRTVINFILEMINIYAPWISRKKKSFKNYKFILIKKCFGNPLEKRRNPSGTI